MASTESNIAGRARGTMEGRSGGREGIASPRHVIEDAWRYPILVKVIQVLSSKRVNRSMTADIPNDFGVTRALR